MRKFSFMIIPLVISVFIAYSLYKNYSNYLVKQKYVLQAKKELEAELEKKKKLVSEFAKAQDYSEIEYTIREKLNLARPGEYIYIIDRPTPTLTPTPTLHLPPLKKWINLIW